MMKNIIFILVFLSVNVAFSQKSEYTDYLNEVKKVDVSDLWTTKVIKTNISDDNSNVERNEPLGYIGKNYQRFYIHFISVIQNPTNRLEYYVYGKTKVKENICTFQGKIIIIESKQFIESFIPTVNQGYIKGDYKFYEDPNEKGTGIFKGSFITDFFLDSNGQIKYNGLYFGDDGYRNNQFEGTWKSYLSGKSKKCNWGDYRIPDSKKLDGGAGEFGATDIYVSNGWITYMIANGAGPDDMNIDAAKKSESKKWWIEK